MKNYDFKTPPIAVYGAPMFASTGRLDRLPESVAKEAPLLLPLYRRCPGARLGFRTDSKTVRLRIEFERISPDIGMSIYACQSANLYVGPHKTARYAGIVHPNNYNEPFAEGSIRKSADMEDVFIFLPRNEVISNITIGLDDDARIKPPTPYAHSEKIVYYGSSITEGGCCSKPANAYNALVSAWLDVDYFNLGFSGAARGELIVADYILTLPMDIFVYDYDHNAPTPEHLKNTHEPFFRRIREARPTLPILMMTRPGFDYNPESAARREIVYATYEHARAAGDENVYFLDGQTFFGTQDREACTNDTVHPNDLGMYRMAKVVAPVIERLLK